MKYPLPGRIAQVCLSAIAIATAAAQTASVKIINLTRPGNPFQVGDQFDVEIAGPPNQPVSVRTERGDRVDWGPIAGRTDPRGHWSSKGTFAREDYGS
jgi:hypothetical protein